MRVTPRERKLKRKFRAPLGGGGGGADVGDLSPTQLTSTSTSTRLLSPDIKEDMLAVIRNNGCISNDG